MRDQNKKSSPSEGFLSLKVSTNVKTPTTPTSSQLPSGPSVDSVISSAAKNSLAGRKLSLSLSQEAALRLHSLSSTTDGLSLLGVLSGSVADQKLHNIPPTANCFQTVLPLTTTATSSSWTIPSRSSKGVSSMVKIALIERTKSDPHLVNGDSITTVQRFLSTLASQQRLDTVPTTSSSPQPTASTCTVRSRTEEDPPLLPPNVVATTSQPVPVPSLSLSSNASPASLFPFSSMTKVALTIKTSTSQSTSTVSSISAGSSVVVESVRSQPRPDNQIVSAVTAGWCATDQVSPSTGGSPVVGKARNVSMTSPLLINLLQTSEHPSATISHDLKAPTSSTPKRTRKKKFDADVPLAPLISLVPTLLVAGKKSSRPKKKKKLEEGLNGISASNLPNLCPVSTAAQIFIPSGSVGFGGDSLLPTTLSRNGSQSATVITPSQGIACTSESSVSLNPAAAFAPLHCELAHCGTTSSLMATKVAVLPGPLDVTSSLSGISAAFDASPIKNQESLDNGPDLISICNGQYSLSAGNELSNDLTEELADEDLLAILENASSENAAMTSLFNQSVSSDSNSITSHGDLVGTSTASASKTNGTESADTNDTYHPPIVLPSPDYDGGTSLRSPVHPNPSDPTSVGTFKQPFVPKVSYVATVAPVSLSSSSRMNSSLVTSSSGASSAVRLEITSDNTGL